MLQYFSGNFQLQRTYLFRCKLVVIKNAWREMKNDISHHFVKILFADTRDRTFAERIPHFTIASLPYTTIFNTGYIFIHLFYA